MKKILTCAILLGLSTIANAENHDISNDIVIAEKQNAKYNEQVKMLDKVKKERDEAIYEAEEIVRNHERNIAHLIKQIKEIEALTVLHEKESNKNQVIYKEEVQHILTELEKRKDSIFHDNNHIVFHFDIKNIKNVCNTMTKDFSDSENFLSIQNSCLYVLGSKPAMVKVNKKTGEETPLNFFYTRDAGTVCSEVSERSNLIVANASYKQESSKYNTYNQLFNSCMNVVYSFEIDTIPKY